MLSIRINRWTIAALSLAVLAVPGALLAQTPDHTGDNTAQFPSKSDLKSLTTSGSYLAARHASVERDAASAAAFYRSALRTDPKNNELLDRAFISSLAEGDIDEAVKLADRILTLDKSNRVARLVVGVRDLKQKKYATAQLNINQSIRGPITDLVATLLSGWASLWRRRRQGGGRQYRQADGTRMVSDLQGPARRHDLRALRQGQGRRPALRARLQARRFHAARGRRICALVVAQQGSGRRRLDLRGVRQEIAAASAGAGRPARDQGRQEAAAAGRFGAGRRRRGALRHRRHADAPRRRGSGAGLSAARALSAAHPFAGAALARRSL